MTFNSEALLITVVLVVAIALYVWALTRWGGAVIYTTLFIVSVGMIYFVVLSTISTGAPQ